MTNFLNRLAGRALGILPVAQPIVPTRFEPTADRMGSSNESDSSATDRAGFRAREIEPSPEATAGPRERALPYSQSEVEPHTRLPSNLPAPARMETHSSQRLPLDAESSAALSRTGRKQQQQQAAREDAGSAAARRGAVQPEIFGTDALGDHRSRDQRGAFSAPVRSAVSGAAPNQAQRPVRDPVPGPSSPSTEPVIRVTIGRIDVRAELASPPTPAARRTRPSALSLDQYLKQRSGAGR